MAIQNIVSGTGFTGIFAAETRAAGITGVDFKPVARWVGVPGETYRSGTIFMGVMAYHSEGIKEVEFFLNGGTGIKVTEQSINPTTNLPEYCVAIDRADVVSKMGEKHLNTELRAVVRPNVGEVKILQHDAFGLLANGITCSGDESAFLFNNVIGFSGGQQDPFGLTFCHPGEHSGLATILNNNNSSTYKEISRFMSPTGLDSNAGTREAPVKTIKKALELLVEDAKLDEKRVINSTPSSGIPTDVYDVSDCFIELLPGTYTPEHYNVNFKVQNGTPITKQGWFTVTGDRTAPRDSIILDVPEEMSRPVNSDGVPISTSKSSNVSFNIKAVHNAITAFKLQHLKFTRHNVGYDQHNFNISHAGRGILGTNLGYANENAKQWTHGFWFDDVYAESLTVSHSSYTFNINATGVKFYITNCKIAGGQGVMNAGGVQFNNLRIKNAADLPTNTALFVGNEAAIANEFPVWVRKIDIPHPTDVNLNEGHVWYDKYLKYREKFNGFYAASRGHGTKALKNSVAFKDFTSNRGSGGFTTDIPNATGAVWRKIKTEGYEEGETDIRDIVSGFYKNKLDETDGEIATYRELGQQYGRDETSDFFDPEGSKLGPLPFLWKKHAINGGDAYNFPWENTFMALLAKTSTTANDSGLFPPLAAETGYVLFDADKPLVYGSDENPNTQEFLFRFSGTTKNVSGHNRAGGIGNFYDRGNVYDTFPYAFAEGVVGTQAPRPGNAYPGVEANGATNDTYPILCRSNYGSDDSKHADMMQWWITTSTYTNFEVPLRIENILYAYNKVNQYDAQMWNVDTNLDLSHPNYPLMASTDWAFVNNVLSGPEDSTESSTWMLPAKNVMLLNNTMFGPKVVFKAGEVPIGNGDPDPNTDAGTLGGISGAHYSFYFNEGDVGKILNPNGVSIDCFSGHWILKNNILPPTDFKLQAGLTTGPSAGISTDVAISHPWVMNHNYYYPYGNGDLLKSSMFDNFDKHKYAMEIGEAGSPLYKNLPTTSGGAQYDSDLIYNFNIENGSDLIGGASGSVPFDMNRRKRIERSTPGAYEPSSVDEVNYKAVSGTVYNSTDVIDLGVFAEELYGKAFKIVAIDSDGNEKESTNTIRLENKWARYAYADVSQPETYEFDRQTGTYHRSTYTPREEVGDVPGETTLSTNDWLPVAHGVEKIILYGNLYGGAAESTTSSTINLFFEDAASAAAFKTAHDAIPGKGIRIDLLPKELSEWVPSDGYLTRHFDKGVMIRDGNKIKTYLNSGTEGATVAVQQFSLPGIAPIFRPNEM